MGSTHKNGPIDFVLIWVDGNDPKWQEEYSKYKGDGGDRRAHRFRDTDMLQYWFRGVEKFAPWVNKVYFVTCGQRPDWLNTEHPKLVLMDHKDFIPAQYLPTFSSQAIEVNLHRIPGLSEQFVYFNDDTYIVGPVKEEDFFVGGLPCDSAVINYAAPRQEPLNLVPFVNAAAINRNFVKKQVIRRNFRKFFSPRYHEYLLKNLQFLPGKWFPGFKYFHQPSALLKSTLEEVWEKEYALMDRTSSHKFRVLTDANQWLFRNWQVCSGRFEPQDTRIGCYESIEGKEELDRAAKAVRSGRYKLVCPNDAGMEDFDLLKRELQEAFEEILPEKSEFEK